MKTELISLKRMISYLSYSPSQILTQYSQYRLQCLLSIVRISINT